MIDNACLRIFAQDIKCTVLYLNRLRTAVRSVCLAKMLLFSLALLVLCQGVFAQIGFSVISDGEGYSTVSLNGLPWFDDLRGVSDVAIHKVRWDAQVHT